MNKTTVFVTFAVLAGLGIIGSAIIQIVRPDASAVFISQLIQILGLVTLASGTFAALGKQGEKLDTVVRQTNGNLSHEKNENQRLASIIEAAGLNANYGEKHNGKSE